MEARVDAGVQIFKKLYGFFSKDFKTSEKTKGEQSLFADVKQPSNSKIFASNTIEDQTKIEYDEVIKSIVPKNHLRPYPEPKSSLNVSSLIQIMRNHFSEYGSSSTLTEMSNLVQSLN